MKQKKESTRNLMLIITGLLAFCMITKEGTEPPNSGKCSDTDVDCGTGQTRIGDAATTDRGALSCACTDSKCQATPALCDVLPGTDLDEPGSVCGAEAPTSAEVGWASGCTVSYDDSGCCESESDYSCASTLVAEPKSVTQSDTTNCNLESGPPVSCGVIANDGKYTCEPVYHACSDVCKPDDGYKNKSPTELPTMISADVINDCCDRVCGGSETSTAAYKCGEGVAKIAGAATKKCVGTGSEKCDHDTCCDPPEICSLDDDGYTKGPGPGGICKECKKDKHCSVNWLDRECDKDSGTDVAGSCTSTLKAGLGAAAAHARHLHAVTLNDTVNCDLTPGSPGSCAVATASGGLHECTYVDKGDTYSCSLATWTIVTPIVICLIVGIIGGGVEYLNNGWWDKAITRGFGAAIFGGIPSSVVVLAVIGAINSGPYGVYCSSKKEELCKTDNDCVWDNGLGQCYDKEVS